MKQASIIFLPCTNINKTVSFYHDLLGLPIIQKQTNRLYIFDTGYGYWGFCQYEDERPPLSGPHGVCLSLDFQTKQEVQKQYEHIKAVWPIYKELQQHPNFPVYSFFIQDPDGYIVEFQKRDTD